MKYADGHSSAPPMPLSIPSFAQRSVDDDAGGVGRVDHLELQLDVQGHVADERPSSRMYAHLRSSSHSRELVGPMCTFFLPMS